MSEVTLKKDQNEVYDINQENNMSKIVAAYVQNHQVDDLSQLIKNTYATLKNLTNTTDSAHNKTQPLRIKKHLTKEAIFCQECGRGLKMLKKHLLKCHNMDPLQYKEKWGLPKDYPLTAPDYSKVRSAISVETRFWA